MARLDREVGDCGQYFIQGGLWERGSGRGLPAELSLLPLIAQRPALVRWNRDAESIYELEETIRSHITERS